jgi:orotate phosphoribosyltransferase
MSSLEELISRAKELLSEGHSPGQIADELSLSMETVTWLLTQQKGAAIPKDVHIDWTSVSREAGLLEEMATMMLRRYESDTPLPDTAGQAPPDAIVGIAVSGVPLATLIAVQMDSKLAIYHPAKHGTGDHPVGSISGNFAGISGARCIIVDDVITSGKTLHEMIGYLRTHAAVPVAIWVIFDKRGIRDIEGVPVYSLFRVSRID